MKFVKQQTDEWCASNVGKFCEADENTTFISGDTTGDVTGYSEDGKLLFKFLSGNVTDAINDDTFAKLRRGCVQCDNRGYAAGEFDVAWYQDKMRVSGRELTERRTESDGTTIEQYRGAGKVDVMFKYKPGNFKVIVNKQTKGNEVRMGMLGWIDSPNRMKKIKSKCRQTAFTENYPAHYEAVLPLITGLDKAFMQNTPARHSAQVRAIERIGARIGTTAFSTVTINYNWRTAMHVDRGDFIDGFGVFSVVENTNNAESFIGNELFFPQYNVCINVRAGDVLLFDTHQWHCNNTGRMDKKHERISLVCYLRVNLLSTCNALPETPIKRTLE